MNEHEATTEDIQEITTSSALSLQDIDTLNNNIVSGFMYVTGALGIVSGLLLGIAFHGIFRSK